MQICEIVLYGYNGKVRHLPFSLGKVNIITGRSKSGKSVVGDIIDYCLGGESCNIADGVVRDNVAWYGLLLQFDKERVFVARKNPDKGQQTKENVTMEVGTVYGGYYGAKGYEGVRKEEKRADAGFAGKVAEKGAVSPKDMTLEEYKAYFNEKMNSLYTHPSQRNMNDVIDITDAAYKRMQTDPEYEKKILDALAQNKAVNFGGNIPVIAYMHIDDTWEKCYGYTQGMKENVGYSGSSSAKRTDAGREKKARQKELLEEYLEKRAQAKRQQQELLDEKIAKAEQERSRLAKAWSSKQQMAKASSVYESNIMTETVADGEVK